MTLLDWLEQRFPTAKRQTLKRMLEAGRVHVNGLRAVKLKTALTEADKVIVSDAPHERPVVDPELRIIFEDADLVVVQKPEGLLTSTVPDEPRPTLLAKVRAHVAANDPRARLGLIHRLDRDASGLLVFSKNEAAYESLKRQFFNHSVDRVYAAVVEGIPSEPSGIIRSKLIEKPDGTVVATTGERRGQIAVTEFVVLRSSNTAAGPRALLRVKLQTGRKHQIRSQLAERGTPIVNDPLYGTAKPAGRMMLAAMLLSLRHPRTAKRVTWDVGIPVELREAIDEKPHS